MVKFSENVFLLQIIFSEGSGAAQWCRFPDYEVTIDFVGQAW